MTTLPETAKADSIVLGGGCFWCLDASYKLLPGVTHVTCGYSGGTVAHPSYEMVCTEETGHAEVIRDHSATLYGSRPAEPDKPAPTAPAAGEVAEEPRPGRTGRAA